MPPTHIHFKTTPAMKQKLLHQSLIVTLVTMLLLLAGSSVSAQEEYGLMITGVAVTSANCSDLSVIDGVKGKVSYDPATKTLYLTDATIEVTGSQTNGIWAKDQLTCVVTGNVSITTSGATMAFFQNAIIKGDGRLTLKSQTDCAIYLKESSSLIIDGCTVSAEGKCGIAGDEGDSSTPLTIKNASVTVKGTEGSILDLKNLILEGC